MRAHPALSPRTRLALLVGAVTTSMLVLAGITSSPGVASSAAALRRSSTSMAGDSRHHRPVLVYSRQICDSDSDPCWELVVSDAHQNHPRVVAGPYQREVWDDHFVGNWAPDGRSIIFMADLGTGQAIWRVRTDGTHLHKVFTPPDDGSGLDDGPAFTPDGRHIIFTRCCPAVSGYALWSVTPDGRHLTQVTSEVVPPGVDGPSDNLPQVSPDGRTVGYHRNVVDSTEPLGNRISVAPLSTGIFTDLTDPVLDAQIPNWSPDGRMLVFQTDDPNVWRVNRDGSHPTQLTFDDRSINPSYTPDGHIIFGRIAADGSRDLYTMRADGSHARLIKAAAGIERFPHMIRPSHRGKG